MVTEQIPWIGGLDSSAALLREGYAFGANRFLESGSDVFETRLMLHKAVIGYGTEAVGHLYDPDRMTRRQALPAAALTLLQDFHSVEQLDDEQHRHRKAMFMSLMSPQSLAEIADLVDREWRTGIPAWQTAGSVVLFDAVREVLCRAVCAWSGVPLTAAEVPVRARELGAMVQGAGSVGPKNVHAHLLRHRAERWAGDVLDRVRRGELEQQKGRAAHTIAWHRDQDGQLLDLEAARVELINILRPTVAVARYIVFAALALHRYPDTRAQLADGGEYSEWFVNEVRRYYPFFPMVGGRVRQEFDWRGRRFQPGAWFLVDLYATNHDPRIWDEPGAFRPERFATWDGDPDSFVPQGGGEYEDAHRCAGEWLTIRVMQRAVQLLTTAMTYEVPLQDLTVDLSRMPAAPSSGLRISNLSGPRQ